MMNLKRIENDAAFELTHTPADVSSDAPPVSPQQLDLGADFRTVVHGRGCFRVDRCVAASQVIVDHEMGFAVLTRVGDT